MVEDYAAGGAHTLAGPGALLAVLVTWISLLAVGWALIYWPHLTEGFLLATSLEPSNQNNFSDALYLSLVTLATLGYGDIVPASLPLRMLATLESLVGFGILTAAISYLLSIYTVLSRRQSLAHQINLLRQAEHKTGTRVEATNENAAERTYGTLTAQLVAVRGDLLQFPITYYFHSENARLALPATLPELLRLAERGSREGHGPGPRC